MNPTILSAVLSVDNLSGAWAVGDKGHCFMGICVNFVSFYIGVLGLLMLLLVEAHG